MGCTASIVSSTYSDTFVVFSPDKLDNNLDFQSVLQDKLRCAFFKRFLGEIGIKHVFNCWEYLQNLAKLENSSAIVSRLREFPSKYVDKSSKWCIVDTLKLSETEIESLEFDKVIVVTKSDDLDWLTMKCRDFLIHEGLEKYLSYESTFGFKDVMRHCMAIDSNLKPSSFHYMSVLGQGTFGMVLKCASKLNSRDMLAMKVQLKDDMWQHRNGVDILIEQEIFEEHSDHPYIIDCLCSFNTTSLLYLVMPLAHCTLGDLCKNCPDNIMSFSRVQFYAAELVCVLKYLHENSFVYCDLKPSNVMIGMDGHVQLTDFGSTCRVADTFGRCTRVMGTLPYMAPEVMLGLFSNSNEWEGYTCAVDWWSLGVLTYELLVGKTPFDNDLLDPIGQGVNHMPKDVLRKVKVMNRYSSLFKPVDYSMLNECCVSFVSRLLDLVPEMRIDWVDPCISKHCFFDGLEWSDIENKTAMPPFTGTGVPKELEPPTDLSTLIKSGRGKLSRVRDEAYEPVSNCFDPFVDWKHIPVDHIMCSDSQLLRDTLSVGSTLTSSFNTAGLSSGCMVNREDSQSKSSKTLNKTSNKVYVVPS